MGTDNLPEVFFLVILASFTQFKDPGRCRLCGAAGHQGKTAEVTDGEGFEP